MNQIVLDIDLDYAMGESCYATTAQGRRDLHALNSVSIARFERLLDTLKFWEDSDGLAFETHTVTAKVWESLILNGTLKPPFDVIHVDAHHDIYLAAKHNGPRPSIHCGNYPIPFLRSNLIDKFTWVAPNACGWDGDHDRFPRRVRRIASAGLAGKVTRVLKQRSYAFVTVAFSPNYCGIKTDALIPSIMERLNPSEESMGIMHALARKHKHEFTRAAYYLEESPYFKTGDTDGMCSTLYLPRLVKRMRA